MTKGDLPDPGRCPPRLKTAVMEQFASALDGVRWGRNRAGESEIYALCPCHDDAVRSFAVTRKDAHKCLFHCYARCSRDVLWRELQRRLNGGTWERREVGGDDERGGGAPLGVIVAQYVYDDPAGNPTHRVLRYLPKDFRQQSVDQGRWAWGRFGFRWLYRAHRLATSPREIAVVLVEGERDVVELESRGFLATTLGGASARWYPRHLEQLQGRTVVVIPDDDPAGDSWLEVASSELTRAGVAWSTLARPLSEDAEAAGIARGRGFDAADWFAAGHEVEELRGRIAMIARGCAREGRGGLNSEWTER
jgi:hypothetical protein